MNSVSGGERTGGPEIKPEEAGETQDVRQKEEAGCATQDVKFGSSSEINDWSLKCFKPQNGGIKIALQKMSTKWKIVQQAQYRPEQTTESPVQGIVIFHSLQLMPNTTEIYNYMQ